MIFILIGAPGAGKGTQAEILAKEFNAVKVSTGDALRRQIARKSSIGQKAEAFVTAGRLVPDDILVGVLEEELKAAEGRLVFLDGYPRNLQQAQTLDGLGWGKAIAGVLHIDVSEEEIVARLSGRQVCADCGATYHKQSKPPVQTGRCDRCPGSLITRADDQADKIRVRLHVYKQETEPVLEFYRSLRLYHRIDGELETNAVALILRKLIEGLSCCHGC